MFKLPAARPLSACTKLHAQGLLFVWTINSGKFVFESCFHGKQTLFIYVGDLTHARKNNGVDFYEQTYPLGCGG